MYTLLVQEGAMSEKTVHIIGFDCVTSAHIRIIDSVFATALLAARKD